MNGTRRGFDAVLVGSVGGCSLSWMTVDGEDVSDGSDAGGWCREHSFWRVGWNGLGRFIQWSHSNRGIQETSIPFDDDIDSIFILQLGVQYR